MGEVKLNGFICERCEHTWISRNLNFNLEVEKPRVCPKCKSPYWNTPRKNGIGKIDKQIVEIKSEIEEVKREASLFPPKKTEREVTNLFPPK